MSLGWPDFWQALGAITYMCAVQPNFGWKNQRQTSHTDVQSTIKLFPIPEKKMANMGDSIEVDPDMVCWRNCSGSMG
jgi:hypothetical protein